MKIRPITYSDLDSIIQISDSCFGNGYIFEFEIENRLGNYLHNFVLVDDKLIKGFIFTSDNLWDKTRNLGNEPDKEQKCNAIIDMLAIDKTYQNKGYGTKLVNYAIDYYKNRNFSTIFYPFWMENNQPYFLQKIKRIGFSYIKTYNKHWEKSSLKHGFNCSRCGPPPCLCSMQLFALNLSI